MEVALTDIYLSVFSSPLINISQPDFMYSSDVLGGKAIFLIVHSGKLIHSGFQGNRFRLIHFFPALDAELVSEDTPIRARLELSFCKGRGIIASHATPSINLSASFIRNSP